MFRPGFLTRSGISLDRYLYASGQPNRVAVTDVLQESLAQQISLHSGDVLMSLDDQRI
jgi:hypothetical protein